MDFLKQSVKKIFQYEAQLVLKKYKPKIIAITGSVGKTSTREAIYLVLSKNSFVRKSEKSFTAELGVALTIIGCPNGSGSVLDWINNLLLGLGLLLWRRHYPQYLILEIDGDKPGDLSGVASFIRPDFLIMTAVGEVPSHIEAFSDLNEFFSEKKSIINAVRRDGVIIYNVDDNTTSNLLQGLDSRKISCGVGSGSDVSGSEFQILYSNRKNEGFIPIGMSFDIRSGQASFPINICQSIGVQNEYACLLAFAFGVELGVGKDKITTSLGKFTSLPGRMNLLAGIKNTTIIDDSYNSSPVAMLQAVSVLGDVKTEGRKIAVVGDMLELGKYSSEEHRKLAELLKEAVDRVICVGLRARKIAEELLDLGFDENAILSVDDSIEAGKELQNIISEGDIVLVKGSQAMRMERVVEEVMKHPEDKRKLLVRQDEEWLNRV